MSIRALAQELYRMEREADDLRRELEHASPDLRDELELKLRKAVAYRNELRGRLKAKKDPPPYHRTFQ